MRSTSAAIAVFSSTLRGRNVDRRRELEILNADVVVRDRERRIDERPALGLHRIVRSERVPRAADRHLIVDGGRADVVEPRRERRALRVAALVDRSDRGGETGRV